MHYRSQAIGIAWLCVLFGTAVHADHVIAVDRYIEKQVKPSLVQQDILQVIVNKQFDNDIKTVGDALNQLLNDSGYQLHINDDNYYQKQLVNQQLPKVHRHLEHIYLQDALKLLAGDVFELVIDPVHRLVSFRLLPELAVLYPDKEFAS